MKLRPLSLIVIPAFATLLAAQTSTFEDFACDSSTSITAANPTVITCNNNHGFGNGQRAFVRLLFNSTPAASDTVVMDGVTYRWVSTLAGCSANDVLIDTKYLTNNMYSFMAAVTADTGAGHVYCASTVAHNTMDAVWLDQMRLALRAQTGGTSGAGKTVSVTGTHLKVDGLTGGAYSSTLTSSTTQIQWHVAISGATGSWAPINTSGYSYLVRNMSSGDMSFTAADATRLEPNTTCTFDNPPGNPEQISISTFSGATATITARGTNGTTAAAHLGGDYFNEQPERVYCGVGLRNGAWHAYYSAVDKFIIPLDSSGFGAFSGTVNIYRAQPLDTQIHHLGIPMWVVDRVPSYGTPWHHSNNQFVAEPHDGSAAGCQSTTAANLLSCKLGYLQPVPGATGQIFNAIGFTNLVVDGNGIGTITFTAPYSDQAGCAASSLCDTNLYINRLIWLSNMTDATLNTYFVVCDQLSGSGCTPASLSGPSTARTALTIACKKRDGTTCGAGTYSGPSPAVRVVLHQSTRLIWLYQAEVSGIAEAWGTTQGNLTKDSIPPQDFNHITYYDQPAGSFQRRGDGGYTSGTFGTYILSSGDTLGPLPNAYKSYRTDAIAATRHYYYEPAGSTYAGQWRLLDVNWTAFTQVSETGQEQRGADETYTGNPWLGDPWIPKAHAFYNMAAWYAQLDDPRYAYLGANTGGTYRVNPIKFSKVTGEPDELVQSKVITYAACLSPGTYGSCRYTTNDAGYEVYFRTPKVINWQYQFKYSTSADLKTIGFSSGTSGGTVNSNINTSNPAVMWQGPSNQALATTIYIGIRPVPTIAGCSGSGISPIWCQISGGVDPQYQVGDHITTAGITGNTNANQTAAAVTNYQPRALWWLHDPVGGAVSGQDTAYANNGGLVQVTVKNCCYNPTLPPGTGGSPVWGWVTGNVVRITNSGAGKVDSNTGWTITVIDQDNFTLQGPVWSSTCGTGAACTTGAYVNKLINPITGGLTNIVATGGGGVGESCVATLTNDPVGVYPGLWIWVNGGAVAGLGMNAAVKKFQLSAVTHSPPYKLTFTCPGVPDATYDTDQSRVYRLVLTTWPSFSVAGTGNGSYVSGGTVVATDDTKNFTEITFAPGSSASVCTITTPSLPNWTINVPYSQSIGTMGCASPVFSVSAGSLPDGLNLNTISGAITGSPSNASSYSFTIAVADANGNPTEAYTVVISSLSGDPKINARTVTGAKITSP